ncbi:MAG: DUF1566 domain-containing protein [Nitrospirota bacterium]|nr:DUF1566 domain-containing protein [Nitrospirota bacterium]
MKNFGISIALAATLVFVCATLANAELLDRGGGLIYDDALDITWLQNANYPGNTMTWLEADDWAASLVFQGFDDWRLPATDISCSDYKCTGNEMGHLFYTDGITSDTMGVFSNVKPSMYWSSTEYDDLTAWRFNFKYGSQGTSAKDLTRYAWAVRDGDSSVPVAPEPVSSALFLIGGATLTARCWSRKKAGRSSI